MVSSYFIVVLKEVWLFNIIPLYFLFLWFSFDIFFPVLITDSNQIVDSSYDISVLDSNSLWFLFKHAPEMAKELHISSEFSFETAKLSRHETWMVCGNKFQNDTNYCVELVFYAFLNSQIANPSNSRFLILVSNPFVPRFLHLSSFFCFSHFCFNVCYFH